MKSLTNINILRIVERVLVAPVLLYRKLRYGYAYRRIKLAQPRYAIVDPEDYERLRKYEWLTKKGGSSFYARRRVPIGKRGKHTVIYMHQEIIRVADGMVIDHINRNGMDNRRANLRPATRSENARNRTKTSRATSSRYKGPIWRKERNKWTARIRVHGKPMNLGSFEDEIEAAKAYDAAAKKYFGEFACLNFPD